jgi:hypothetical protein
MYVGFLGGGWKRKIKHFKVTVHVSILSNLEAVSYQSWSVLVCVDSLLFGT